MKKRNLIAYAFLLPSLCGVLFFYLIPFADVVRRSFLTAVTKEFCGLDNYRTVFQNEAFLLASRNTARFCLFCLPVLLGLGLLVAILLERHCEGKRFLSAYLLPMAVPSATVVLVWKMFFAKQGLFNAWLGDFAAMLGKERVFTTDYMDSGAAFWVLVASYIWKNLGYTVTLWFAGLLAVSSEQRDAARVDGAGAWQVFWRVVFPQLLPNLYTIGVLSFLNAFKVFREAYLVAGSYPHESMYMLQHLFNNWFVNLSLDKMAAAAVVTGAVMITGILLLQRLWEKE